MRFVVERAGGRCERCGDIILPIYRVVVRRDGSEWAHQVHPGFEINHRIPLVDGGSNEIENLELLCARRPGSCHWVLTRVFLGFWRRNRANGIQSR